MLPPQFVQHRSAYIFAARCRGPNRKVSTPGMVKSLKFVLPLRRILNLVCVLILLSNILSINYRYASLLALEVGDVY